MSRNRAAKAQRRMNSTIENTISFTQPSKARSTRIDLIPRTRNQENFVVNLRDPQQHIVVAVGPAGTGKTYLAMQAAVKALREGDCQRIVLTRPAVGVEDERHGFLPGNLVAKMEPWTRPLFDVLREHYRSAEIMTMIDDQIIEIAPLAFMRGRTFKNAWIIADEMQNATPAQTKMLMTRIGQHSKILLTGDIEQADRQRGENGLWDLVERLQHHSVQGIAVCTMTQKDVQRHEIIRGVLQLYQD